MVKIYDLTIGEMTDERTVGKTKEMIVEDGGVEVIEEKVTGGIVEGANEGTAEARLVGHVAEGAKTT